MARGFKKEDSGLVSLELDDEDQMDMAIPSPVQGGEPIQPQYPWTLRICLTEKEMEKLGLDHKEASRGDYLDFRARACVTSIGPNGDPADKEKARIELQIEDMKILDVEEEQQQEEKPDGRAQSTRKRGLEYDKDALPKSGY